MIIGWKTVMTSCFCKHGDTSREFCRLSLFVFDTLENHSVELSKITL